GARIAGGLFGRGRHRRAHDALPGADDQRRGGMAARSVRRDDRGLSFPEALGRGARAQNGGGVTVLFCLAASRTSSQRFRGLSPRPILARSLIPTPRGLRQAAALTMAKKISESNVTFNPSHDAIARRAYEIWQGEGCPDGRAMEHWL